MSIDTIYIALYEKTGARPQAIQDWCSKHGVDPYLSGGVIVSNTNEFICCLVDDKLSDELKQKLDTPKVSL